MSADIGLIGLAVMGQNLVLNMNDNGFTVCVFNRTVSKVKEFIDNEAKNTKVIGAFSLEEFTNKLKKPRKVMLMVKAGKPVDDFINNLLPYLEKGDIIIDGGNSEYTDTTRRCKDLNGKGFLYVGSGVSGGEEGARYGPSIMPGGSLAAWVHLQPIFQAIAAKVNNGEPCCDWVGLEGAGHFVKMVHNGIEYGDMQVICEAYHLMRDLLKMGNDEISKTFELWNKSELDSFLIEITAEITKYKDEKGEYLVEKIRDTAGQKGTGKWTAINALDFGIPVTLIVESVFSRCLSSFKSLRIEASNVFKDCSKTDSLKLDKASFLEDIRLAVYASKIISYTQGFMMMKNVSDEFSWDLNLGKIALMWRGGCIIRSKFLQNIKEAYDKNPKLYIMLFDDFFKKEIIRCQEPWRRVASTAAIYGLPVPAISCALSFFDGLRTKRLPANLLQAQRDYFGAHQFELLSNPGVFMHTNWTGRGGTTASSTYQA